MLLRPAATVLRGIAQIFFLAHPGTGVLILAGVALASPGAALLMALGSAGQATIAWLTGARTEVHDGRQGYNGALVGAVSVLYVGFTPLAVLLTLGGALLCTVLHRLVTALFASRPLARFGLPVSTAPFCLTATTYFLLLPAPIEGSAPSSHAHPAGALPLGIGNSFAEVVLTDGWATGLLIFLGVLIGSRSVASFSLAGALIGVVGASAVIGWETASAGLQSYSAVLAAAAVGTVFTTGRPRPWRLGAAALAAALTLPVGWAIATFGGPVLTWPYLTCMWVALLLAPRSGGPTPNAEGP